ncbi:phage tail length tape measure family protein [Sphingobium agri]|nr:phage tail length tape measure family protein [Sphingobium agri]
MEQRAANSAARLKSSFDSSFNEIQNMAKRALTLPRTDTGALNLDPSAARAAASAAQNEAQALREIATAARSAAAATGDTTQETRLYLQAASAAAVEAEQNARSLSQQATALDRLQAELNQTSSATRALNQNQSRMDAAARNNQLAMRNLGFQVSDVGASLASGSSLFVVFGQQIGQVGGALSDMTGKAGALGRFLTNPWVAALTTAAIVVGVFYDKMNEGNKAFEAAQLGADGLSQAQSVLGNMFDLTSGKLEKQNALLILNARLTAANLRAEAIADRAKGDMVISGSGSVDWLTKARGVAGSILPGAIGSWAAGSSNYYGALDRGKEAQRYFQAVRDAKTDAEKRAAGERAIAFSERTDFTGLSIDRKQFQEGVTGVVAGEAKEAVAKLIDESLDDKKLAADLRREGRARKPRDNSKAVAALGEYGRDAADRIADITSRFGADPSRMQQAEKAVRDLDDIIDDLSRRKPPNFEETIKSAEQAKIVVQQSLDRPFRDLVDRAREREQVDALIIQGRYAEADALQQVLALERQMGPLNEQQLAKVLEIAKADEQRARALEDQRRQVGLYVQAIGDVQNATEKLLSGGSIADFGKNLLGSFKSLQARIISEGIFGGLDREIEDRITGRTDVREGNAFLAQQSRSTGDEIKLLGQAVAAARGEIAGGNIVSGGSASLQGGMKALFDSDDFLAELRAEQSEATGEPVNGDEEIIVTARKQTEAANDNTKALMSSTETFNMIGSSIVSRLKSFGIDIPDAIGKKFGDVLQGASLGMVGGSLAASVMGGKQNSLLSGVGGVLGKELLGGALSKGLGSLASGALGKTLGALGGPLGGIIGGALGGIVGGLFKPAPKYGTARLQMNQYGELEGGSASGNDGASKRAASGLASSVADGLMGIADQLGAKITNVPTNIVLGTFDGKYRVNTEGRGGKMDFKGNSAKGLHNFGDDQQAAIEFAIQKSIEGSVITGISKATENILKSGQDLDRAMQKALMIENIPKELQRRLDPVGYAIDEVNRKWERTVDALREGGATAEQMADAQKLYNMEMAEAKENAGEASQSLKDFIKSMNMGSSSPLSLRDQEENARKVLDPYLGQIARGETIDQDKYLSAAQTFLDIERQLYGSTAKYFEAFDMIQGATGSAISKIDNAAPIRTTSDPFNETTAKASQATAANTANTNTLLEKNNALMEQVLKKLEANASAFTSADARFVNGRWVASS